MWAHWRGRYGLTEAEQEGVWNGTAAAHAEERVAEVEGAASSLDSATDAPKPKKEWTLRFKTYEGDVREVAATQGDTLLEVAKQHGLPAMEGTCGGNLGEPFWFGSAGDCEGTDGWAVFSRQSQGRVRGGNHRREVCGAQTPVLQEGMRTADTLVRGRRDFHGCAMMRIKQRGRVHLSTLSGSSIAEPVCTLAEPTTRYQRHHRLAPMTREATQTDGRRMRHVPPVHPVLGTHPGRERSRARHAGLRARVQGRREQIGVSSESDGRPGQMGRGGWRVCVAALLASGRFD